MLRINSTTTRAVTAFDVVGLFCILLKCRPTASCRSCGARIIIRYMFTVKQKRCIPSKNKQKKQPRKLSPARPLFNKMQGNHPLCPHSTHHPHIVKLFLPLFLFYSCIGLLRRILPIPSSFASASIARSFHSLSNTSPFARRSYSFIKTCSANKRR